MKVKISFLKQNRGSYSIETAIIMTIVFMIVLFLIAVNLILYEQARVNAIAESAANRAALVYSVNGKNMETGAVDPEKFLEKSPYWRLFDLGQSGTRVTNTKNYINNKINKNVISDADGSGSGRYSITVKYQNYFIYKRVRVEISTKFKVPFGGFVGLFIPQLKNGYPIKAEAEAAINDQTEMIRTVDMVSDILGQFPTVQNFTDKYSNGIANIKNKISGGG